MVEQDQDSDHEQKLQNTAQILLRDCKPFLEQINYKVSRYTLLRGIPDEYEPLPNTIITYRTIKQRFSRDTSHDKHITFDDMFEHVFGTRFRSNAIFTTGDPEIAHSYGHVQAVFPIGQFKYLWSPRVGDLYQYELTTLIQSLMGADFIMTDRDRKESKTGRMVQQYMSGEMSQQQINKMFEKMAKKLNYKTTGLKEATKQGTEIMVSGDSFYMTTILPLSIPDLKQIEEYVQKNR